MFGTKFWHWVVLIAIFYVGMVVAIKSPNTASMATGGLLKTGS